MHGGAKIHRFASFRLAVLTSTGPLFWFVWTEHERTHALKDRDRNDFVKLLQWANFHGIRCSCCHPHPHSGLSRGQLRCRGAWFEDPRTCWPNDSHPSTCTCISCTACCVTFKDFLVRRLQLQRRSFVLAKQSSVTPRQQAETDLAIQFAWRRWLRHRLPSANTFAPRFASAEFAETWYLD